MKTIAITSHAPDMSGFDGWAGRPFASALGRPLRVALFSGNYNCVRDGANQALNKLVRFLEEEAGATVRVYSPTVADPAFAPAGTLVSVRSVAIPGRREYRLALGLPHAIRRDIANFDPDIFHLSAPDMLGRKAQKYARARGIPVIASLHTRFETYFDYYGLSILKPHVQHYLSRFYRECDHLLVPNAAIKREMEDAGLGRRTTIWGRGVDRSIFSPSRRDSEWRRTLGYADDDIAILFFGRLVREKGLEMFATVIEQLRARGHRLRPLIVGDGPARDAFAGRLPNVNFTGHLTGKDLGRAVASADILLNPSVTEAFGNVTLEAMAAGLAVVSADVPSASSLLKQASTGILVPPADPVAYTQAIDDLIRSPETRSHLASAAAKAALSYDWPDILSEVASAYRTCVNGRSIKADRRVVPERRPSTPKGAPIVAP